MATPTRIGVFGGTFDPFHCGHLRVARAAVDALDLDRLLVVVANEPWQKADREVTAAEDRFAMVAAAVAGHPGLEASRLELDRGGPSYTVDTVRELGARWPDAELVVVVGADVVPGLGTWRSPGELAALVTLGVVDRPGAAPAPVPPGWRAVAVPVEPLEVAGTELRARLAGGRPVDGLVPDEVVRCIAERGLYARRP